MYLNLIGTDGSGKDAQLEKLKALFPEAHITREPGGTPEAEIIRSVILEKEFTNQDRIDILTSLMSSGKISKETFSDLKEAYKIIKKDGINGEAEMHLYAASRSESLENVIRPNIQLGKDILGTRSVACSIAYQGNARNLGMERVWRANEPVLNNTYPDLEIFLDIPISVALERLASRTEKQDRLDGETISFYEKVRDGYLYFYQNICPYPHVIVDATGSIEEVHQKIIQAVANVNQN